MAHWDLGAIDIARTAGECERNKKKPLCKKKGFKWTEIWKTNISLEHYHGLRKLDSLLETEPSCAYSPPLNKSTPFQTLQLSSQYPDSLGF